MIAPEIQFLYMQLLSKPKTREEAHKAMNYMASLAENIRQDTFYLLHSYNTDILQLHNLLNKTLMQPECTIELDSIELHHAKQLRYKREHYNGSGEEYDKKALEKDIKEHKDDIEQSLNHISWLQSRIKSAGYDIIILEETLKRT